MLYVYSWDNEKYWIDKVTPDTGSGNHSVGFWTGWELRETPKHIEVVGNLHDTPNLLPKNHVNWRKSEYNPDLLTQ